MEINNAESDFNKIIPLANKYYERPKPVKFEFSPENKQFMGLVKSILYPQNDSQFTFCVFFNKEKNEIVFNDTMKLVIISDIENVKYDGKYLVHNIEFGEKEYKIGDKVDFKYPDYHNVVLTDFLVDGELDCHRCLAFIQFIDRTNLTNESNKLMKFSFVGELIITYKLNFIRDLLILFIKTGISKISIKLSYNNSILFEYKGNKFSLFAMLMPGDYGKISEDGWYGDIDRNVGICSNYDLIENIVYSNNKQYIDEVNIEIKKGEYSDLTKEQISVIKSFINNNNKTYLPILDFIKIENKILTCTDLENIINISGINKPDGLYKLEGNALIFYKTISEYPFCQKNISDYIYIGKLQSQEFINKFNIVKKGISNQIHLFNINDKTYIGGVNKMHLYFDYFNSDQLNINCDSIIINKDFSKVFGVIPDGEIDIYFNEKEIILKSDNIDLYSRLFEENSIIKKYIIERKIFINNGIVINKEVAQKYISFLEELRKEERKNKEKSKKNYGFIIDFENEITKVNSVYKELKIESIDSVISLNNNELIENGYFVSVLCLKENDELKEGFNFEQLKIIYNNTKGDIFIFKTNKLKAWWCPC